MGYWIEPMAALSNRNLGWAYRGDTIVWKEVLQPGLTALAKAIGHM